ncbi:hypothetical protein SAY86_012570 [Trapa natans]|uniref:Protein E6-like n=1 Tax=Trapa natans TaxID=22666 RepID=A0AAN7LWW9_TRANT|nr:hypothetical protein SAY86_012570 [Trapa natans]
MSAFSPKLCPAMLFPLLSLPPMASSSSSSPPKLFCAVFFLIVIFFTSMAHARESQFFNKATKETATQQGNDPNFIPKETATASDGYGLYGHETGQLPPSTTAATVPQESLYSNYQQNYYKTNNGDDDNNHYNKDSYLIDEERAAAAFGNRYSTSARGRGDRNTYYRGGNVRQEGMSDTRFMENGKYSYDIDNEEKYYPNYRYDKYARKSGSRSGEYYNMNMVNGGHNEGNYRNPSYENNGNSMGGYSQNQEEFQDAQEEFVP